MTLDSDHMWTSILTNWLPCCVLAGLLSSHSWDHVCLPGPSLCVLHSGSPSPAPSQVKAQVKLPQISCVRRCSETKRETQRVSLCSRVLSTPVTIGMWCTGWSLETATAKLWFKLLNLLLSRFPLHNVRYSSRWSFKSLLAYMSAQWIRFSK